MEVANLKCLQDYVTETSGCPILERTLGTGNGIMGMTKVPVVRGMVLHKDINALSAGGLFLKKGRSSLFFTISLSFCPSISTPFLLRP